MAGFSRPLVFCSVFLFAASSTLGCGDDTSEGSGGATSSGSGASTSAGPSSSGTPTSGPGSSSGGDGGDDPSTSSGEAGGGEGGSGGAGEGGSHGTPCDGAQDCDDDNACTDDACVEGFCENVALDDGTAIESDGEPCTDDECLGGVETHTTKPAGSVPSDEGGGCEGLCQGAPYAGECGLSLYRKAYPGGDDVWTRDALSSIWMGDDAPPPSGIIEAEQAYGQDRLLVWTDDGGFYERQEGAWLPPTEATDTFENLPEGALAMTIAYKDTFGDSTESLTITTNEDPPRVLGYDLLADGTIDYAYGPNQLDNVQASDPDAPPQHETPYDWGFARQTAEPFQGDPWIRFDEALGGSVYELDASSGSFDFLGSDTEEESALFAGDGGPAPGSVVAAYYADGQVFLVAP